MDTSRPKLGSFGLRDKFRKQALREWHLAVDFVLLLAHRDQFVPVKVRALLDDLKVHKVGDLRRKPLSTRPILHPCLLSFSGLGQLVKSKFFRKV